MFSNERVDQSPYPVTSLIFCGSSCRPFARRTAVCSPRSYLTPEEKEGLLSVDLPKPERILVLEATCKKSPDTRSTKVWTPLVWYTFDSWAIAFGFPRTDAIHAIRDRILAVSPTMTGITIDMSIFDDMYATDIAEDNVGVVSWIFAPTAWCWGDRQCYPFAHSLIVDRTTYN